ncbi:hypothetical protein JCM10908_005071 [Rhodotorula pacifica]|uniref:uncharacterized protein n=1 Tax=Rhodotorula pacifica TaxID=1495444 RepID=UPI003180FC6B
MPPQASTSTQPLDLVPGTALGPFQLGSLLFNVLNHVREYRDTYPHAQLAWDEEHPLASPVHLALTTPPLHLTFSAPSQRLSRIQVVGPAPGSHVIYRSQRLQEPALSLEAHEEDGEEEEEEETGEDVVKRIRRILGPTFGSSRAPVGENGRGEDMLCYPGVAFGVTTTPSGSKRLKRIVLTPLPAPKNASIDQAWLHPEVEEANLAVAQGDLARAVVEVDPTSRSKPRITLHFHSATGTPAATGATSSPSTMHTASPVADIKPGIFEIGETTSEDILCELGSAIRTFWKEDDRLTIHTAAVGSPTHASLEPNPYFLSYPHLGLTLLVSVPATSSSSQPHVLEKVILHSNTPGLVQFGRTARALWSLRLRREQREDAVTGMDIQEERVERKDEEEEEGVKVEQGFEAVRSFLRGAGVQEDERPMELDRTAYATASAPAGGTAPASAGREGLQQQQQDSGLRGPTTEIYGFSSGMACEVTQSGDVETLWLF